nr:hypothetical protein [Tanacetum cinerariifolium]
MENLNFFFHDIGTSSSVGGHLTQEEAAKEALSIKMSQNFSLVEEESPIIEIMAYHDKYKKILNEVWKDNVELDGKIVKEEEEEEAVKRIKGEALKEKDDPIAFIFPTRLEGQVNKNALVDTGSNINIMPYRIHEQLGREDVKKVDRGIPMINQTQAEAMGILINVICQMGATTLIAKFLILVSLIDHDSPIVVCRRFLPTIDGIVNTRKRLFSTFDGFYHQTFCAARSDVMRNAKSDSDDEEDYQIKRNMFGAPIMARSLHFYTELYHEFYSTYKFDKVCADDELKTKKIIKFRLGGRAYSLTLLEFARRLGLYQEAELDEEGFNVYFEGALCSDEHFNA